MNNESRFGATTVYFNYRYAKSAERKRQREMYAVSEEQQLEIWEVQRDMF